MGRVTTTGLELPKDAAAEDLVTILDAFSAAQDALLGVLNQPRCDGLAHDVIQCEIDRLAHLEDDALAQLTSLPSVSPHMAGVIIATIINAQSERGSSGLEMLETCASTLKKLDAVAVRAPSTSADTSLSL